MSDHKLIPLLRTFSKEELKKFKYFLQSPYFNRDSTIISLFRILEKNYPHFSNDSCSKEKIYNELYPGKIYTDSTMRSLFFRLLQYAQQYLKLEMSDRSELMITVDLIDKLIERYLRDLAEKNIKKTDLIFRTMKIDSNYFYQRYLFEVSKFNFYEFNEPFKKKKDVFKKVYIVQGAIYYIFLNYLYELISSYIILFIYPNRFDSKPILSNKKLLLIFRNLKQISSLYRRMEYDFVIDILFSALEMFINMNDGKRYLRCKKLFTKNIEKFSEYQRYFLSMTLVSYCIIKNALYGENKTNLNELFESYRMIINNEYYKVKGTYYMHYSLFRGAVYYALKLHKYQWTKLFIERYSKELQPDNRNNMMNYGYAKYYSELGEFEKAMEILNKISLDDFVFKLDLKEIKLQAFYSLGYFEEALELIHTYKEFLRNDQVLQNNTKKLHYNFIKIVGQLVNYRLGKPRVVLERIINEFDKTYDILNRNWISEQIKLLKTPLVKNVV